MLTTTSLRFEFSKGLLFKLSPVESQDLLLVLATTSLKYLLAGSSGLRIRPAK